MTSELDQNTDARDLAPAGYRGRFAPSPTGPLHFGSLVTAVASWLDARARGGTWLVRIEDLDPPREVPGAADAILRTLDAYGLHWDEDVVWQSRRAALYDAALESLRARGLLYPCTCSRREIAEAVRAGRGAVSAAIQSDEPVYPGTCRDGLPPGRTPRAWRFRLDQDAIGFDDLTQGPVTQRLQQAAGDFVLRRADGLYAYQLAVVVDDADQRITHVVRGADLLSSTPRQIALQRALGVPTPAYRHVPVAVNAAGEKLSKQTRAPALDARQARDDLVRALRFLGQDVSDDAIGASPRDIMAWGIRRWDAARIPHLPAIVAS